MGPHEDNARPASQFPLAAIRRANPALQSHLGAVGQAPFPERHGECILVLSCANPRRCLGAKSISIPVLVDDLMRDTRFVWSGKLQRMRLDPADLPFAIWRIAPAGGG